MYYMHRDVCSKLFFNYVIVCYERYCIGRVNFSLLYVYQAELNNITAVSTPSPVEPEPPKADLKPMLYDRLQLYQEAQTIAKSNGETSKANRLGRGVKVSIIQDLFMDD